MPMPNAPWDSSPRTTSMTCASCAVCRLRDQLYSEIAAPRATAEEAIGTIKHSHAQQRLCVALTPPPTKEG